MSPRRSLVFWALVAAQVAILLGTLALRERSLADGTRVTLRVQPVDPVDIVRGNYVALTYDASRVAGDPQLEPGDEAVVGLRQTRSGIWTATSARATADDIDEPHFIRGRVQSNTGGEVTMSYEAIETAFASPERARRIEREMADGALAVIVLDERGNPSLCTVEGAANFAAVERAREGGGCPGVVGAAP